MADILMTISCLVAIGGTWLFYSKSKIAENINYKMFLEYVNALKFLSK